MVTEANKAQSEQLFGDCLNSLGDCGRSWVLGTGLEGHHLGHGSHQLDLARSERMDSGM